MQISILEWFLKDHVTLNTRVAYDALTSHDIFKYTIKLKTVQFEITFHLF